MTIASGCGGSTKKGAAKNEGIEFSATVNNPEGWTKNAKWEFVQLTTPDRYVTLKSSGVKQHISQNGKTVLDGAVPYRLKGPKKSDGPAGPFDVGQAGTAMDSPGFVTKEYSRCECGEKQKYRMYIMYKPAGSNAVWVPLQYIEWRWKGVATFANGEWTQKGRGQSADPAKDTTDHPLWQERYMGQLIDD